MRQAIKALKITDGRETCWFCGGWGWIHPLDTGQKSRNGNGVEKPVYVWAASRAQHQPGDRVCPACAGDGKVDGIQAPKYDGDVLPLDSEIW